MCPHIASLARTAASLLRGVFVPLSSSSIMMEFIACTGSPLCIFPPLPNASSLRTITATTLAKHAAKIQRYAPLVFLLMFLAKKPTNVWNLFKPLWWLPPLPLSWFSALKVCNRLFSSRGRSSSININEQSIGAISSRLYRHWVQFRKIIGFCFPSKLCSNGSTLPCKSQAIMPTPTQSS